MNKRKGRVNKIQSRKNIEEVFALMMSGSKTYKDKENKEKYKPYTPLPLIAACKEVGTTPQNFTYHMNTNPILKEKYEELRIARRDIIKVQAEDNLDRAIGGKMVMNDIDLANLSLKYLEKTDKAYNPKVEIEQNVKNLNLNMSVDEIMQKINDLSKS